MCSYLANLSMDTSLALFYNHTLALLSASPYWQEEKKDEDEGAADSV